jgi:hypothetical protein
MLFTLYFTAIDLCISMLILPTDSLPANFDFPNKSYFHNYIIENLLGIYIQKNMIHYCLLSKTTAQTQVGLLDISLSAKLLIFNMWLTDTSQIKLQR